MDIEHMLHLLAPQRIMFADERRIRPIVQQGRNTESSLYPFTDRDMLPTFRREVKRRQDDAVRLIERADCADANADDKTRINTMLQQCFFNPMRSALLVRAKV